VLGCSHPHLPCCVRVVDRAPLQLAHSRGRHVLPNDVLGR
jgi:hypothetical protein